MSSWATRTHASLRPLSAADAPPRSRAWILPQRKGCGLVPTAIEKMCVYMQLESRRYPHGPELTIDCGMTALAWGSSSSRGAWPCLKQRWRAGTSNERPANRADAHASLAGSLVRRGEMEERNRSERKASIKRVRGIVQSRRAGQAPLRLPNILANIVWRSVRTDKKI